MAVEARLFSYLDTQLSRLGSPNFHELPINRAQGPMQNLQRDGHMRMAIAKGRVSYEPSSLDPAGPREDPRRGFSSFPLLDEGSKLRARPESFGDHFTQARMFWESMTEPEQRHIVAAFAFELGKCKTVAIRRRVLGQLKNVKLELSDRVAEMLGMSGEADVIRPAVPAKAVKPSPALSQIKKATETIAGRKIGLLLTDGTTDKLLTAIKRRLKEASDRDGDCSESRRRYHEGRQTARSR